MAEKIKGSFFDNIVSEMLEPTKTPADNLPRDSQWIMQAFVVSSKSLSARNNTNQKFSTAGLSYQDSSIGGNHVINPTPQFTRYADIPTTGVEIAGKFRRITPMGVDTQVAYSGGNIGRGRFWHEAFDMNKQQVHLRFGVPEYNSMLQFLTGFYDSSTGDMARTGKLDSSLIQDFLGAIGKLVGLAIFPLALLPIAAMMAGTAIRFLLKWPASKFYYLRPAMPLYWNAVTSMVNQIGTNMGVIRYFPDEQVKYAPGERASLSQNDYSAISALFPEFDKSGQLNVYALSNKTKRLKNRYDARMRTAFTGKDSSDFYAILSNVFDGTDPRYDADSNKSVKFLSLESFWQAWIDTPVLSRVVESVKDALGINKAIRTPKEETATNAAQAAKDKNGGVQQYTPAYPEDSFTSYVNAEMGDGSSHVTLAVDLVSSSNESFSSSTASTGIQEKINSVSKSAREMNINLAGGNVDPFGVVSAVAEGVNAVLQNAADMVGLGGGLAALKGSSFVDIPKYWESSEASLPKANYSLTLTCPYNNPVSQLLYIYVPLCMLLAGALPLATGKQSYTAPFMCEVVCRGIQTTRLGIIDSLQITRGTHSLPFTRTGNALGIDVSFSVLDMSTVVAMPIEQGFRLFSGFDTDNSFNDYTMTLSGMSMKDTTMNRIAMLSYNFARKLSDIKSFVSPAHMAQYVATFPPLSVIGSVFMRGTDRA